MEQLQEVIERNNEEIDSYKLENQVRRTSRPFMSRILRRITIIKLV